MRYLHTMLRVSDLDESLAFFVGKFGLEQVGRYDNEAGRFTLVFLAPPGQPEAQIELTWNWDEKGYAGGRNFGHLAFRVEDIYAKCAALQAQGITINRPPRDGGMAFIKTPDGISIELIQAGQPLPPREPWSSMANTGTW
jgi:lactoylglutathione lyase